MSMHEKKSEELEEAPAVREVRGEDGQGAGCRPHPQDREAVQDTLTDPPGPEVEGDDKVPEEVPRGHIIEL
jgi:hypothetical protein